MILKLILSHLLLALIYINLITLIGRRSLVVRFWKGCSRVDYYCRVVLYSKNYWFCSFCSSFDHLGPLTISICKQITTIFWILLITSSVWWLIYYLSRLPEIPRLSMMRFWFTLFLFDQLLAFKIVWNEYNWQHKNLCL